MTVRVPRGLSPLRARERESAEQVRDILERRLGRIARAEREVLQLRLFRQHSLEEAARATHRPVAEVRALQYRGLHRLNRLERGAPAEIDREEAGGQQEHPTARAAAGESVRAAVGTPSAIRAGAADRDRRSVSRRAAQS